VIPGHTSITNCAIVSRYDYVITAGAEGKIKVLYLVSKCFLRW